MGEKRIAVLGAGANGASVGADLTAAGLDVTLVEQWPAHVEKMRAEGVRIESPSGCSRCRRGFTTSVRSPSSASASTRFWC